MCRRVRPLFAAACVIVAAAPAWGATLDWSDLAPPPAAAEDNPFARLSAAHTDLLRELAVSRLLVQRLGQRSDAVAQRERAIVAALRAEGLDAEAMLARRDTLMAERRARAETVLRSVDGQALQLAGYLVPLTVEGERVHEFLLVPWAGACSHTPPPPPNQLLRVRAPDGGLDPALAQRAVRVSGVVRVRPQVQQVTMVDGVLAVTSGYAIDDASVTPLGTPVGRPTP